VIHRGDTKKKKKNGNENGNDNGNGNEHENETSNKPVTLVGNSIGGYTAMYTAAYADDDVKEMINGVVLLNAAGRFKNPNNDDDDHDATVDARDDAQKKKQSPLTTLVEGVTSSLQRLIIRGSFLVTKQPARIEQILKQVYPINATNVNPNLIESIRYPSDDPNAPEVFYRVITKNSPTATAATAASSGTAAQPYIDDIVAQLQAAALPLLLCWGESDPWIRSQAADHIQHLYPTAIRASIDAGHCPHDENPVAVNAAIRNFMETEIVVGVNDGIVD